MRPPATRRQAIRLAALLPFAACAAREEPPPLPPLVTGYRHLTPLRLNVVGIEVLDPAPGAVRVTEPTPLRPEEEMRRMAEDRLVALGTEGTARFIVSNATLVREGADRLSCRLLCRLEILSAEGRPAAFVEAEARRTRTVSSRSSPPARLRAAEDLVRGAMEELNVEFEFQIRRTLRAWLVEGTTPPASVGPEGGGGVQREDLPRG